MRDDLPRDTVTFLFTDIEGSTRAARADVPFPALAYDEAVAQTIASVD